MKLFGSTEVVHIFAGPALSLRSSAAPGHAFITASAGVMRGSWSHPGDPDWWCFDGCDDSSARPFELTGMGGSAGIGYRSAAVSDGLELLLSCDLLSPGGTARLADGTAIDTQVYAPTVNVAYSAALL